MKKLLTVITILILVIGLGACAPSQPNDLEQRVDNIEYILDNLGVFEGLNGQKSFYIQEQENAVSTIFQRVSASEELLVDGLDKSKLPDYLFDINGDPLSFKDVGEMLKLKYYQDELDQDDYFKVGFQTKMRMDITKGDMNIDEFIARTILLIEELSLYEYWLIGGSELYLQLTFNNRGFEIFIYMPTLLSEAFELTPEDYYNQNWEIEIRNLEMDLVQVQTYYDEFILSEIFDSYVLDYN